MQIKRVEGSDIEELIPLYSKYKALQKENPSTDFIKIHLRESLINNKSILLIARVDGRLCGFILLDPVPLAAALKSAYLLKDMFVDIAESNDDVVSALLQGARKECNEEGYSWVLIETTNKIFHHAELYEKNGWVRENEFYYRLDLKVKSER